MYEYEKKRDELHVEVTGYMRRDTYKRIVIVYDHYTYFEVWSNSDDAAFEDKHAIQELIKEGTDKYALYEALGEPGTSAILTKEKAKFYHISFNN